MNVGRLPPLIVFLATGLFVAGPVAACICVDQTMAEMPCCPEGSMGDESLMTDFDTESADIACQLVPASPLPSNPNDLPEAPLVTDLAYPGFAPRAPPSFAPPDFHGTRTSPPIYLLTLRLRV